LKLLKTNFKKAKALAFSAALLLGIQTSANAGQAFHPLTPLQTQHLSHDLTQTNSQDFFRQGHEMLEREIQILAHRRLSSTKPLLKIDEVTQVEKDRSPSNSP